MSEKKPEIAITDTNLEEFKKLVRRAIFLDKKEEPVFNAITNDNWRAIFATNFDGNFEYAKRMLLYKYKEVEKIDTAYVDREKSKIANLKEATDMFIDALKKDTKVLFITDFDNDGSLAQAVINEYLEIDKDATKNVIVEYAQTVNGNANRGFTIDHVDLITSSKGIYQDEEFLIVTADNGINSREEQKKILEKYPKAKIIVTDHHNPDEEMVVEENDRTVIFNPHYKPTEFFSKFNISGATTVGVLLKNVLKNRFDYEELQKSHPRNFEKLGTLFKVANLLDYVNTHPADKPEKDYIITKFIQLQPLMNINNSISKIITGELPTDVISSLKDKIPQLNTDILYDEAKNIHTQNTIAKVLLKIHKNRKNYTPLEEKKDPSLENFSQLTRDDFYNVFLQELKNVENYTDHSNINPNYIEQLRPLIFGLGADYEKTAFMDSLEEKMVDVFKAIKLSESKMIAEVRRGEVVTQKRLENSSIIYADPNILKVFNRKFLNKVYNDENPGFSLTLDNVGKAKVSGSFRSLYDISDILKDKTKLEKQLKVKIETPGHERAAGFIVKTVDEAKSPITDATIEAINVFINNSIEKIKKNEIEKSKDYILTDLDAIKIIDKINRVVRGNVSNFEKVTPILKLHKDMVWTDSYTTQQMTMEELVANKKYGYVTLHTDFHGGTIIIPVELIRRIVKNDFKDYLSLGYMDSGVFMVDRVTPATQVKNIVDITTGNDKTKSLVDAWERDFKTKNSVNLSREEIMDNPFFKYHDYGKLNFELFEKMVIGIIDTNNIDTLAVFDVEANGFGNSKLINIGSTNYGINPTSGSKMPAKQFFNQMFRTSRKEDYLLNEEQISELVEISLEDFEKTQINLRKVVLQQYDTELGIRYFMPKDAEKMAKKKTLPYEQIRNYKAENGQVTFNREIKATMLAFLVKDKDFRIPQEMTNLTGITQELLNKYGKETTEVDSEMAKFYEGKKVLFGAHNTPYDARVVRANLPNFYNVLKSNKIYDSALFAKEEKLAYDSDTVTQIPQINAIVPNVLFHNNRLSDFNLRTFIEKNENGYYPERNNNYLLEIDNGEYFLVDKIEHEKIKINATKEELLKDLEEKGIPANSTKYSVEKMSEQWMIHALLLNDETFEVKLVDLNNPKYESLKPFADEIKYFQENYHFDINISKNISNFRARYMEDVLRGGGDIDSEMAVLTEEATSLTDLTEEFLELNKEIVQKFTDAWMYKRVLEIKDPTRLEVTNDLVDLVNYQTSIPKDKIRQIFDDAIAFKNKHDIDHVIQHEMHANGPWRTDAKGDIAFEDKLTLCLLANKEYNPYSHTVDDAIYSFNRFQIKARLIFDVSDGLSDSIAQDSYSFRQGILYDRDVQTEMIEKIQQREEMLTKDGKRVIKYKLDNDILPPKTNVYAVVKENATVSREQIEDHKKKLSFIMLNEQLKSSYHNAQGFAIETLKEVYEANIDKILQYKQELADVYSHIEYNKKDYHVKEFLDKAVEIAIENKLPKRQTKTKKIYLENVDEEEVKNVQNLVEQMVKGASSLVEIRDESYNLVKEMLDFRLLQKTQTSLERALENNTSIKNFEEVGEENFLKEVDITRKTPLERLIGQHQEYRLINGIVEEYENYALSLNKKSKIKP
jgi:hypothetical protein